LSFFELALLNRSTQLVYQKVFDSCRWDSFSKISLAGQYCLVLSLPEIN